MKTIEFPVEETHSPILIYEEDSLQIIEANPAALSLYGYEKEAMESMTIRDLLPEEELPELKSYEEEGEKDFKHTSIWQNKTGDGSIIYVRIQANFVNYKDRKCRLAIIHDVTEKIRSQRRYRLEHELMQSLLNKLPGMYLLLDREGRVRRWNQKLERISQYSEEQIEQKDILEFIGASGRDSIQRAVGKARSGNDAALESVLEARNGEKVPIFANLTRIDVNDQQYIQVVGLDISHLKKVEWELRQANEEKETMLTEIHHRVKNNLAVISSMIELQAMEEEKTEVLDKLNNAKMRVKSIALIHELLYQSQSFTNINFAENLKRLVDMISDTLVSGDGISIDYRLEPVELNVNEAMPLANIANELVTNAFKHAFGEKEEGLITLELYQEDKKVHLKVSDNGRGVPKDFEPEETQSLGFSIINSLVTQLDAELEVYNDDGAHFEITLTPDQRILGSASNVSEKQMSEFTDDDDEG